MRFAGALDAFQVVQPPGAAHAFNAVGEQQLQVTQSRMQLKCGAIVQHEMNLHCTAHRRSL